MTETPAEAEGPLLVTVKVKVTLVPTVGVLFDTPLTIDRSAEATGVGVEVLVLLPGVGSPVVELTVAVFA
ncbi:hypothetical protein ASE45_05200 [Lysobacter sp. Root96]|nr:hypothetical protein ASE45_05200 [Lysobacter sp. Root96]